MASRIFYYLHNPVGIVDQVVIVRILYPVLCKSVEWIARWIYGFPITFVG